MMDTQFMFLVVVSFAFAVTAMHLPLNYTHQLHHRQKRAYVEKFDCQKMIQENGMDLMNYGIEVLSDGSEKYQGQFFTSLGHIFNLIQNERNATRYKIAEALQMQYRRSYNRISKSKLDELEATLIRVYTEDEIYGDLSYVLAQHDCTSKTLSPKDKALAPYATALFATILYWGDIIGTSKTTYRGIGDLRGDITTTLSFYKKGKSIVLPQFTSSSDNREASMEFLVPNANNIFLIIDNSRKSLWRPKGISQFSQYPDESEFLYPPAAKFKVKSDPVKKTVGSNVPITFYEVKLQLDGLTLLKKLERKIRKICRLKDSN